MKQQKNKELLFSLTKKDFVIQTFRCGGKGGQNVNKRDTGVRIIHPPSGAMVRCCDERHQAQNKKLAFERLAKSKEFLAWHKVEVARRIATKPTKTVDEIVDEQMSESNLKVEYLGEDDV